MPVTRMRMRPWLEQQIQSNNIPGLQWVNEVEGIFQIPWKHAARHGWDIEKDACLFRSWAIHTGKFKVGEKEPDPKTWKANFRCAMNSLPDIKEVRDKSIYKGSSAVRVYKMLPAQVKTDRKERKSKSSKDCKDKSKNKQTESLSADEAEEAVKNCQLPDDHNNYTASLYPTQEIDIASSELLAMHECEVTSSVPDWKDGLDVPVPADSINDMYSLQVSPMGSEAEDDEATNEILKMLDPVWQQTSIDGKGFFTNESGGQNSYLPEYSSIYDSNLYDTIRLSEFELRVTTEVKPGCEFTFHELTSGIMC